MKNLCIVFLLICTELINASSFKNIKFSEIAYLESDNKPVLDSTITYSFNSKTDSVFSYKEIYLYDNDNLINKYSYRWDDINLKWIKTIITEIKYDSNNNTDTTIKIKLDEDNNQWVNNDKTIIKHDIDCDMINLAIQSYWDKTNLKWIGSDSTIREFDDYCNEIYYERFWFYPDINEWKRFEGLKTEYEYDDNGKIISISHPDFTFKNYYNSKEEYYYDSLNRLTSILYKYDGSGESWSIQKKTEYNYDINNNIICETQYKLIGDWAYENKTEFNYDNNNLITEKYFEWKNQQWVEYNRIEKKYNSENNLITLVYLQFDSDIDSLVNSSKAKYNYDDYGNVIIYTQYKWDDIILEWNNYRKNEYRYNSQGEAIEYIYYNWNDTTLKWDNDEKTERTYDNYGNMTSFAKYEWNDEIGLWIGESSVLFNMYHMDGRTLMQGIKVWNDVTFDWDIAWKKYRYYSDYIPGQTESIKSNTNELIKIYPNPASDKLIVDLNDIKYISIFNINGILEYEKYNPGSVIDISNLNSGLYIMHIKTNDVELKRKVIIE